MLPFRPNRFLPAKGPPALSARERALAQWRGTNLVEVEKAASLKAQAMSEVMATVVDRLKLNRRRIESELVKVWNELLDPTITAHAQPHGLVRGTLFVRIDSSVWLDEIVRYRRKEILERLQHSFGADLVRKISFRVG